MSYEKTPPKGLRRRRRRRRETGLEVGRGKKGGREGKGGWRHGPIATGSYLGR